jgi:hypothetical protein
MRSKLVSDVPESNGSKLRRVWPEVGELIDEDEAGVVQVCDNGEIVGDWASHFLPVNER